MNIFHRTSRAFTKRDQLQFAQQLLALMQAGLPLLNAVSLLSQSSAPSWQDWLSNLCDQLQKGNSLSQSLKSQGERFSIEFINLIRVSERSGQLILALKTICEQLQAQIELRQKIQQSLAYPAITLGTSFLLVAVMLIWVVPVFKEVFGHFQAELPAPTQALIAISDVIENAYIAILIATLTAISALIVTWKKSLRMQKYCDRLTFKIPFIGNLFRLATLTYWCRTLGHLLHSGLPLPDALRVTAQSSNHWLSHDLSADIFKQLTRGWPLGAALKRADPNHLLFDIETWHLLQIGAESGSLAQMLQKRADILGAQLEYSLNTLSHSIEPFFIIFVGLLIGSLVIILYLPIFNLGQIV